MSGCLVWVNIEERDCQLHITHIEDIKRSAINGFALDMYPDEILDALFGFNSKSKGQFYKEAKFISTYFLENNFAPGKKGEHPFLVCPNNKNLSQEYIEVLKKIYCFKVDDDFYTARTKIHQYNQIMHSLVNSS